MPAATACSTEKKLSQADQPAGIARKDLPASAVLPAVNSDGSQIASIDAQGRVLLGQPGKAPQTAATDALTLLPGSNYPARPLWQPGTGALLYATAGPNPTDATLLLRSSGGATHPLATVANLQQYAWSPDGHWLLARTTSDYRLYSPAGDEDAAWNDSASVSLAFWSPDSRFLLILEPDGASLVNVATRRQLPLLNAALPLPPAPTADQRAVLRPATNSPWKPDSSVLLFTAAQGSAWGAQPDRALPAASGSGDGLYATALDPKSGAPQFPTLLDWGEHQSVAWSTLDPNCAFLLT
jgi:hypothetical protein